MKSQALQDDTARLRQTAVRAPRSRWLAPLAVVAIGGILSLALFWSLRASESARIAREFDRDASDRVSAFRVALTHGLDALTALDGLYRANRDVDRSSFTDFVSEHLLEEPGVAFLGWAPRVRAGDRERFERTVRSELDPRPQILAALARFSVFELTDEMPAPAEARSDYFPVLFAEPPRVARHTLGFDVASDLVQREGVLRAQGERGMIASGRDLLNPAEPGRFGVLVMRPVFRSSGTEEEAELRGLLLGMIDVRAVLEAALSSLEPRGLDIAVFDLEAPPAESLLHFHSSRLRTAEAKPWARDEAPRSRRLAVSETVEVGDRRWSISCRSAQGYVTARTSPTPVLALVGGLLLSFVLAGAFASTLGRESEARTYAQNLLRAKSRLEEEASLREQTSAELAISEERFRLAFGFAPMGTGTMDLEGRITQANPALCRLLRCEKEELLGTSVSEFVHPEDAAKERAELDRLLDGETESVQYVVRLRRRDASVFWAELNVSLVRDSAGQPLYFVGQQQDITERRAANEEVRKAREMQERILDSLPLNVFLKDSQGRLQFLNAKGRELLGRTADEVIGKTDFDLFPEAEAQVLRRVDLEALESGETVTAEESVSIDGREVPLLAGKTRIEIEGSDEPYLLGFSLDLTPVREAEAARDRSERRFRQLVENMKSGVAVYEAIDDGADFVFRDYNPAAETMDGISRDEVLGRRVTDVFPGVQKMGLLEVFRAVWQSGEARQLPASQYRDARFGSWRENHVYRLPSGEIVAIYDDVSERKRLETDLLHAQKMEAVGRLAGGVAHDFNNLLQVVAGNIDLLLESNADSAERDRMLREIQGEAERGTQLVRRLLAFSRREEYSPRQMDLRDLLAGAETLMRRLLKENIELEMRLSDEPLPVAGDPGQLEQVLMNFVVNASDAMPRGGTLEVGCGAVSDGKVYLSVADTGPGIPEELVDKIFDPYFTTKPSAQGTGLGLAVVDGIIDLHGGRIEIENGSGGGALFKVSLPRAAESSAVQSETTRPAVIKGGGQRVLVVEDQELVRRTMETMLVSLGYRVTSVADGGAARERLTEQDFDLLVSDIVLPDTTGVELAHEFRAEKAELAVLLVSGYAEEAVRDRGADLLFLQKPFRLEDLAAQVAAALRERSAGSS